MEWEEAKAYLAEHPEAILLDIRSLAEYRERRIPGSRHLSRFELTCGNAYRVLGPPPSRGAVTSLVMVYCRTGLHSDAAVARLRQCGYKAINVGSIRDWQWELEGSLV